MTSRLRDLRKFKGLTQHTLAAKSGVSRPVIARIESGKTLASCKADTLIKLASGLGISIDELLNDTEQKPAG